MDIFKGQNRSPEQNNSTDGCIPFALRVADQLMVAPDEVERGLKCGCICVSCRTPLVAKQGERRVWHFAHYEERQCLNGRESAIHQMAKQLILSRGHLYVPKRELSEEVHFRTGRVTKRTNNIVVESGGYLPISNVMVERQVVLSRDTGDIHFQPDVLATIKGIEVAIEIKKTNSVNRRKQALLLEGGISIIEIDVSDVVTESELEERLFSQSFYSNWICHVGDAAARERLREWAVQYQLPTISNDNDAGISQYAGKSHIVDLPRVQLSDLIVAFGVRFEIWTDGTKIKIKKEGSFREECVLRAIIEFEKKYGFRLNRQSQTWETRRNGTATSLYHEVCSELKRRLNVSDFFEDEISLTSANIEACNHFKVSQVASEENKPPPDYPGREKLLLEMVEKGMLELFEERAAKYHYEAKMSMIEADEKAQMDCQVDYALMLYRNERR